MITDLEHRLHDHLDRAAGAAPASMLHLDTIDARAAQRRRHRSVARGALAVGAIVGLGAGVLAMRDSQPIQPAGSTPTPLTRLSDTGLYTDLVKPGAVALLLADGRHLTFAITAMPFYDGYSQQTTIKYDGYSTGRAQPITADLPLIPEPELGGDDHVVYWTGIPASAATVELHLADGQVLSQQPVEGIAAFPVASHSNDDTLIALDAAGNEVARTSWMTVRLLGSGTTDGGVENHNWTSLGEPDNYGPVDVSKISGLSQAEEDAYRKFADTTMRSCLSANGAASWTECIQSTDAAVKAYLG